MNKLAYVAIAAVLPFTGCASTPNASSGATLAATPGTTMYCWKGRLTGGATLQCNWEPRRADACNSDGFSAIDPGKFSDPQPSGMCPNGQYLVMVQAK